MVSVKASSDLTNDKGKEVDTHNGLEMSGSLTDTMTASNCYITSTLSLTVSHFDAAFLPKQFILI